MPENLENKNIRNDEIDLLDLFRRTGRGIMSMFNSLGQWLLTALVFMLRNWYYLVLSVAIGVGLSYALKYSARQFYTSEMVILSNAVPTTEVIAYTNKLHTYCQENNREELAAALGLDEEKISIVKDIEAFWVIDRGRDLIPDFVDYSNDHDVYDTIDIRMPDRLAIRVKTFSPGDLGSIKDGIFSFIKNNPLFIDHNNLRIRQLDEMLIRVTYDIEQLDSLQKIKYFEETKSRIPDKGGQMIFLQEQKTQLVYNEIYNLWARKQDLESKKTIYSGIITLLNDFTPPIKPKNSGMYYGQVVIPFCFLLCLILLILRQNKKRLITIYNKY